MFMLARAELLCSQASPHIAGGRSGWTLTLTLNLTLNLDPNPDASLWPGRHSTAQLTDPQR